LLTTTDGEDNHTLRLFRPLKGAAKKFKSNPRLYVAIPLTAAFVGWLTNWLAVQMIFYPIHFRGIPLIVREGSPLGLLGWQGIVPAKSKKMSEAMVDMVTEQLLDVREVFGRLDAMEVAVRLKDGVAEVSEGIVRR